ncbi:unnamed protein product [Dovyalis caffra]|uniref:Cytochrome P450 n=1 Tax=Dovyalis caffra TaxID=77055 RepID=A0AAV1S1T2_9ROSI|nr:unnamed protein product [Dovyalis caffra]
MAIIDGFLFCCFMVSIWFFCTSLLKSLKNHTSSGTKLRRPPSPPALPIIGHLHLLGSVLGTSLHRLAQRYGPFIQLRLGASTCYVVSDAEIAKEVLKTNEMNFVSRLQFDTTDCNIYEGSGFITAPYNAYWRFMKKLCMTRLLNTTQINQLVHIREDEMKKLAQSLVNISKEGELCDLRQAIMTMTNNVICRMSMSTRCLGDGANNEAREIKDLVLQVSLLGGKLSAGNVLGPLAKLDLFGYGRQLRVALEKFDRLVERIIKEHEEKEMKGTERSEGMDLMDILLEISRDPNAEMKLTRKEIKAFFLRDPNLWTDPEEFIPERFMVKLNTNSSQMEMKGQNFNFLPFGSGRRGCPGATLALAVVESSVAVLVQCFDWKAKDGEKIDMQEGSGFSMGMAKSLFYTWLNSSALRCQQQAFSHLQSSYSSEMAKVSISKAIMVVYVVAVFMAATNVSVQAEAPAPAPSTDTGAGFSLPVSSAVIAISLVISCSSLLKH